MICEEFGGKDLSPATCAATKRNGWCDRTCEKQITDTPKNGNGGNGKSPQNTPIAIVQDSSISENTPKEVQSTNEPTKTIVGHPGKEKGKILGTCGWRNNELLTWTACNQRRRKKIGICRECDQSPFIFSKPPKGRGWANSAARAIEVDCPDLGRKVKLPSCRMKQGKLVRAGKTCDVTCQYWKGGNPVVILCQKCSDVEVKRIGQLCLGCEAEERKKPNAKRSLITMWCPTCQTERMGIPGHKNHCGVCEDELRVKQPDVDPMPYFCPTPYCAHKVEVEGMLCGDCQIEGLKKVEGPNINPAKPKHIHLIGISEKLMRKIDAHERGMREIKIITESMQSLACEILAELQKAVKEVEGGN